MSGFGRIAAWLGAAGAAALAAGCASKPEPAPAPAPTPVVRPAAPPPSPPPPPPGPSQQDAPDPPLTPGDWSYAGEQGGSVARFGTSGGEIFSLRCDPGRRQIILSRQGSPQALKVRTSYGQRTLPVRAELPPADPLLDEMVFSRGRFIVEAQGMAALFLPTWPEPARVIEDCRG